MRLGKLAGDLENGEHSLCRWQKACSCPTSILREDFKLVKEGVHVSIYCKGSAMVPFILVPVRLNL